MAPKATKKGTSDTNIGRLITDLSGRVDHLERAFEDLNKGSAERVIDRMHELEKETTREYIRPSFGALTTRFLSKKGNQRKDLIFKMRPLAQWSNK